MPGPAAAVAAVRVAVRRALDEGGLSGCRVLVGCSGGADSVALAAAAAFVVPRGGGLVGALVVDHGLQPDSSAVAEQAALTCARLGLDPVQVTAVRVRRGDTGPEDAARQARFGALVQAAAQQGAEALLLGHTLQDQAEQVLLGLARGSGARSLAGMPAVRGAVRRPLLGLDRSSTVAACAEAGLDPWHDPSNADPSYARARVRSRVLPVLEREIGPGAAAALVRTADQLRADADALDALAADLAERAVGVVVRAGVVGEAGGEVVEVDLDALAGQHEALRTRVLRTAALRAGCPATDLARTHVLAMAALARGPATGGGLARLPGGIAAARRCGTLRLWTQRT